jgi:DNA-damage-inducible protein J
MMLPRKPISEVHAAWFQAKVLEALEDTRPDIEDAEAEVLFSARRMAALIKASGLAES